MYKAGYPQALWCVCVRVHCECVCVFIIEIKRIKLLFPRTETAVTSLLHGSHSSVARCDVTRSNPGKSQFVRT